MAASAAKGGYELSLVDVMGDYAFIEIIETKRDSSIDLGWATAISACAPRSM